MVIERDTMNSCSVKTDSEPSILKYVESLFNHATAPTPDSTCQGNSPKVFVQEAPVAVAANTNSDVLANSTEASMSRATERLTVNDRGPIKSMQLPEGWSLSDTVTGGIGQRLQEKYSPGDGSDTTLSVYYRGLPLNDQGADAFKQILASKPADSRSEVLTPREIRLLKDVMGPLTIGNNQYTNDGSTAPPNFHVGVAATTKINGKTVLEVDGNFVDSNGNPVNHYRGIFADANGDGKVVEQVMLEGTDQFSKHLKSYKEAIHSIQWQA